MPNPSMTWSDYTEDGWSFLLCITGLILTVRHFEKQFNAEYQQNWFRLRYGFYKNWLFVAADEQGRRAAASTGQVP